MRFLLKECPFCKGEVEITNEDNYGYDGDEWYIECEECGIIFGFAKQYTVDKVIKKWNTRL